MCYKFSPLSEVTSLIKDGTHGTHARVKDGIPLISAKDIALGRIEITKDTPRITNEEYSKIHKNYSIKMNDLLITVVGTLGRCALVTEEHEKFSAQRSVGIIRGNNSLIDSNFLYYAASSSDFHRQLVLRSKSTAQAGVYLAELAQCTVPVPPLAEQKKIAEILSGLDALTQIKSKNIDKLNYLKKAEINKFMIKNHLKSIPLKKIATCQGGFAFKSLDATTKGTRWLKIANVSTGQIDWKDQSFLPHSFKDKYSNFVLKKGDIVLAMTRPIISNQLKVARIENPDEGSLLNQRVGRIIPKETIVPDYLYLSLQFEGFTRQLEEAIAGSDPPNVSSSQIESLLVPLPDITEQIQISSVISSIQSLIEQQIQSFKKIQLLKTSVLQDLLSGRKRVNI